MRTLFNSSIAAICLIVASSCNEGKNHQEVEMNTPEEVKQEKKATANIADISFVDGMTGKAWHNYLQLKMALVNTDADAAKKVAANLAESFDGTRIDLKNLAQQISESGDIETQRKLFSQFTTAFEPIAKKAISGGSIYKQFCPMAFNNEGAYWLSDAEEIRNPYFGSKMLKCGKVTETIEK